VTGNDGVTSDCVTVAWNADTSNNHLRLMVRDNYAGESGTTQAFFDQNPSTTNIIDNHYVKIVSDGSTLTGSIYTDSSYTTLDTALDTNPVTIDISGLTLDDMQYVKYFNRDDNSGGKTSTVNIDDMTVTNPPSPAPNYTTNISGSLDEFFINSDTLTSTEISGIADRGAVLTPLTTTTATTYDDNTAVGGNTYYYAIKSENAVGLS
ncbi:MAG: hypothetical protein ACKVJN_17155, partial [Woeseiales bacterium]